MRPVALSAGALCLWLSPVVSAQNARYSASPTGVGQLRSVGESSVISNFGRVGGYSSGRLSSPFDSPAYASRRQVHEAGVGALGRPRSLERPIPYAPAYSSSNRFRMALGPSASFAAESRYRGFSTRSQILRSQLPEGIRGTGPLRDMELRSHQYPVGPVTLLLNRRNLLSPRSAVGRMVASRVGLPAAPAAGGAVPPAARPASADVLPEGETLLKQRPALPPGQRFDEALNARLNHEIDQTFEDGVRHFRAGNLTEAQNCFEACKLTRGGAKAYAADAVTAYARNQHYRAAYSLGRAVEKCDGLEDIRLDVGAFYGGRAALGRIINDVNIAANRVGNRTAPECRMLLAYFAWLNGDAVTGLSAVQSAEKDAPAERIPALRRFRQLLLPQSAEPTPTP